MKKNIFLILISIILTSCGGASEDITVHLSVPPSLNLDTDVSRISLRVTASDIATPITASIIAPYPSSVSLSATVPVGTSRLFEVFAPLTGSTTSALIGRTTMDTTATGVSVPISMHYVNFADDTTGTTDNLTSTSTSRPDIQQVTMFYSATATNGCAADSVVMIVDLLDGYVVPSSVDNTRTIIELDSDSDATTGRSSTLIQDFHGTLTNAFTAGSEIAVTIIGPHASSPMAVFIQDLVTHADITSTIAHSATYATTGSVITTCLGGTAFLALDPDHRGRFNVMTGNDPTSSSITPGSSYVGNDILFRTGTVDYNFDLDTSTLP